MFVGYAVTIALPSRPMVTRIFTPSRVPSTDVLPPSAGVRTDAGSFATSLMASITFSSDQSDGNVFLSGVARPSPCPPPPLPLPSRMYLPRSSASVASPGLARLSDGAFLGPPSSFSGGSLPDDRRFARRCRPRRARTLVFQGQEETHKSKANGTCRHIRSRSTCLDDTWDRSVRDCRNASPFRIAEKTRPPIYANRLRGSGEALPGRGQFSMCPGVNDAFGCTPELIDCLVSGGGIKQLLAEPVSAHARGTVSYGNSRLQTVPACSTEPRLPSGSLVPRRIGDDAASQIIDALPDAERIE